MIWNNCLESESLITRVIRYLAIRGCVSLADALFRGFAYVDFALLYSSYVAWTTSASYEVIISGGFSDTAAHQLDTLSARLSSWHLTSQRVLAQRRTSTRIRRILGKRKRVEEEERRQPLKSCSRRASLAMVSYYWLIDVYYTEPEATGTHTSNPESVRGLASFSELQLLLRAMQPLAYWVRSHWKVPIVFDRAYHNERSTERVSSMVQRLLDIATFEKSLPLLQEYCSTCTASVISSRLCLKVVPATSMTKDHICNR